MSDALILEYETLYQTNLTLLDMSRKGDWDDFIVQMEKYLSRLQTVMNSHPAELEPTARDRIAFIIEELVRDKAEIMQSIRSRLDTLQLEIASLNRGKKCNLAYAGYPRTFSP